MLRLTLKNLWSHKGRLALTTLAVTLGVSFVTSAFILTDSLGKTFDDIAEQIAGGIDLQIRGEGFDPQSLDVPVIPLGLADEVADVDGVAAATPSVVTVVIVTDEDGEDVSDGDFGPPNLGLSHLPGDDTVTNFEIIDGPPPSAGEVSVDRLTMDDFDLAIGDTLTIRSIVGGPQPYEITSENKFGDDDGVARYFLFDLAAAQGLIGYGPDEVQTIDVSVDDGASVSEVKSSIREILPEGTEIRDNEELVAENAEAFNEFLDVFRWVLLTFALIALLVSIFVIANTFAIVLGQRIRELGLLRALGASERQVTSSVLFEALAVGAISSGLGLAIGWLLSGILSQVIGASGEGAVDQVVTVRTIVIAVAVGVVVTSLSALMPALRAGRISPMAALREGFSMRSKRSRTVRLIAGGVLSAIGIALVVAAAVARPDSTLALIIQVVVGALAVIVGVALLSPTIAKPFTAAVGSRAFGTFVLVLSILVAGMAVFSLVGSLDDLFNDPDVLDDLRSAFGEQAAKDLGDTGLRFAALGSALGGMAIVALVLWILSRPWLSFTKPEARKNTGLRRTGRVLAVIALIAVLGFGVSMAIGLGTFPFLLAAALMLFMAGRAGRDIPGRIARGNAMNNPRRTASTATSLMIGLALISTTLVVAASLKASFTQTLGSSVQADYFVYDNNFLGYPPDLADSLEALPEVDQIARYRQASMSVQPDEREVRMWATTEVGVDAMLDVGIVEGSADGLDDGGILIHEDPAADLGLEIGDPVEVVFKTTEKTAELTLVGIFEDASILENWVIPLDVFDENTLPSQDRDSFVALTVTGGIESARPALESVMEDYPDIKLEDIDEFQESQEGFLNQFLTIINVMLGLAIVIALIGIANTIALSVFERTRELGLVRAVGMSRTQVKQMIRWESVVIAVFGAIIGMAVGVLFGFTIVSLMPDSVINTIDFPTLQFLAVLTASVVVGIGAAYLPSRRAARLDVLDAIAEE